MKIAVIGSGNVGKALAGSAVRAGHQVTIAASDPAHAEEAARVTKARPAGSGKDAVRDAELVLLAVPAAKVDEAVGALASELDGKVVVDVTNRVNAQEPGKVLDGTSIAEHIQERVPGASVVKAFNYAFASRMADPNINGTPIDAFVAGDDKEAKRKALEFAESIGFRAVDAGPLAMARALEAMALLLIVHEIATNAPRPWQSGWKMLGLAGEHQ